MIILDARRIKAYECLAELGKIAAKEEEFLEELWGEFLMNDELMGAFMYYLDHHTFNDSVQCEGAVEAPARQVARAELVADHNAAGGADAAVQRTDQIANDRRDGAGRRR
ncbi:MAG: hypothetical protein IKH46_12025, partial [Lachnospiraceae bacterium]|nr:hypothetical protein [Lachnospiraceae bacterium]